MIVVYILLIQIFILLSNKQIAGYHYGDSPFFSVSTQYLGDQPPNHCVKTLVRRGQFTIECSSPNLLVTKICYYLILRLRKAAILLAFSSGVGAIRTLVPS